MMVMVMVMPGESEGLVLEQWSPEMELTLMSEFSAWKQAAMRRMFGQQTLLEQEIKLFFFKHRVRFFFLFCKMTDDKYFKLTAILSVSTT